MKFIYEVHADWASSEEFDPAFGCADVVDNLTDGARRLLIIQCLRPEHVCEFGVGAFKGRCAYGLPANGGAHK